MKTRSTRPSLPIVSAFLLLPLNGACGTQNNDEKGDEDPSSVGAGGTGEGATGSGGANNIGTGGGLSTGGTTSSASGGSGNGGNSTGGDGIGSATGGFASIGGAEATGGVSGTDGGATAAGGTSENGTGGMTSVTNGSSGCAIANPLTGADIDGTITVGTRDRTYRLSVPADYVAGEPLPVIFGLNGVGGNGKGAQSSFRLEDGHRGIFVYPDSIYKESSGTEDWEYSGSGYDVDFFDALVSELSENYCVDLDRIFAVGVSAGGIMSNMLGCFRGDVLRGIAPSSAMTWGNQCKGNVAVMVICGETDSFNPCDTDAAGEIDIWTKENSCGTDTAVSTYADICSEYLGCDPGNPVLLCKHPGGHMWPTAASSYAWDFFMGL